MDKGRSNIDRPLPMHGVMIFDAHSLSVKQFANQVAASFQDHNRQVELAKARGDDNPRDLNYIADLPELVFLEEALRETCDAFDRRVAVYEPIVDSFVDRLANKVFSDAGVHVNLFPFRTRYRRLRCMSSSH
mmetsp:Transcript_2731/g.5008  ORF Transcript_2731/g.5008 Transcript_2731/m.5008 type:complete len:132 (+) Transcript_2731:676-1071(+)